MLSLGAVLMATAGTSAQSMSADPGGDYNETYDGVNLYWEKAEYNDPAQGSDTLPFGLSHPASYSTAASEKYPLVLYLHGAAARGTGNQALIRATARNFAKFAQTAPAYNAFVLTPHVPNGDQWVDTSWGAGPYDQDTGTHSDHMKQTESLLDYLTDAGNNTTLESVLGMHADHVDTSRIYVVGDSMGAYGTWDIVGRNPGVFAAAISAAGSGPKNKLTELAQTPFWALHAVSDGTVPNALPTGSDIDGDGSLGMLALMDPTFDNTGSTALVTVDDPLITSDDPTSADKLIYSEFPSPPYGHGIAPNWTNDMNSDYPAWLFSHQLPEPATLTLLGVGGLALLRVRRPRRRR
jgi:dienelactone hydrolase